jgi:hypothetical protein
MLTFNRMSQVMQMSASAQSCFVMMNDDDVMA